MNVQETYAYRINIVLEHINKHLGDEIDLARLAEISHFSPYHFHRIFKGIVGEPVGAFIVRMRVESAARLIRYSSLSIEEIAYKVGYQAPSSLTKVFKQFYDISPNQFRNNQNFVIMKPIQINELLHIEGPKQVELPAKQVIYIRLSGNYISLDFSGTWRKLWKYVQENNLFSPEIEHIAIYMDDPKVTEADKLRTDLCLVTPIPAQPKGDIGVKEIPGGKYAIFTYTGSYEDLGSVYDTIYGKWLPASGYEVADMPCFEKYVNNPANTKPEDLITEIYIPIN